MGADKVCDCGGLPDMDKYQSVYGIPVESIVEIKRAIERANYTITKKGISDYLKDKEQTNGNNR